jgi:hypothetical protein
MIVARALKNSQLTCGERHAYFGDRTLFYGAGLDFRSLGGGGGRVVVK